MHTYHVSINLCALKMHIYFAGCDSVYFARSYAAKSGPTGVAWGLMHILVMMYYPVMDSNPKWALVVVDRYHTHE